MKFDTQEASNIYATHCVTVQKIGGRQYVELSDVLEYGRRNFHNGVQSVRSDPSKIEASLDTAWEKNGERR